MFPVSPSQIRQKIRPYRPIAQIGFVWGIYLRVGAAQELLRRGHTTSAIMRAGGWRSVNVLARYLEEAEVNVWA